MNKKTAGFIHIFLVTLIAAIGIGTVGYFAYKNGQIKLPGSSIIQPTPSSSEPTPFSKYYNGRVSFEYPSTWSIDESRADQEYNGDITLKKHWAEIRIKLNREGFDAYPQPTEFEEVYLDKIKMYKYQRNDYYGSSKIIGVTNNDKNSKGLIDLNGVLYTIELTYPNTVSSLQTDTPESIEHEFDQILSTFKFINTETSKQGWKKYTNEQYSFEFSYPDSYQVLTDKENLYGWPNAILLLHNYGQSYDLGIELWKDEFHFKEKYKDPTLYKAFKTNDSRWITLYNANKDQQVDEIISTFKFTD